MSVFFSLNRWGERYIESINRSEFTDCNSNTRFLQEASFSLARKYHRYIFIGSDSGLLIPYILDQAVPKGTHVTFIEPDHLYPLIRQAYGERLREANTGHINLTVSLISQSSWPGELQCETNQTQHFYNGISVVESLASLRDFSHCYLPLRLQVNSEANAVEAWQEIYQGSNIRTRQQLVNSTNHLQQFDNKLSRTCAGTALVFSKDQIDNTHLAWVRSHADKLFIVCPLEDAHYLADNNIKPDLVTFQSQSSDLSHAKIAACSAIGMPLLYACHCDPVIPQRWEGQRVSVGELLPWHTDADSPPDFVPDEQHFALSTCFKLGFSQVLCSTLGTDSLSQSSVEVCAGLNQSALLSDTTLELSNGETSGVTWQARYRLEQMYELGRLARESAITVLNLNPAAYTCRSIPTVNYAEVKLPEAAKARLHLSHIAAEDIVQSKHRLLSEFTDARQHFHRLRRQCKEAAQQLRQAYRSKSESKRKAVLKQLDRLRRRIESGSREYLCSITHAGGFQQARLKYPDLMTLESDVQCLRALFNYYSACDRCAASLIRQLDTLIAAGKRTLADDESEEPTRTSTALSDICQASRTDTCESETWTVHRWVTSLMFLYKHHEKDALLRLGETSGRNDWLFSLIQSFAHGLNFELSGDKELAVDRYQQIIDQENNPHCHEDERKIEFDRIVEESLLRLTHINLDRDHKDAARVTLDRLCQRFPQYTATYAVLLSHCQQRDRACQLLQHYLARYPGDTAALELLDQLSRQSPPPEMYQSTIRRAFDAITG